MQSVLLVDDSPMVQLLLARHLSEEDCAVTCASTGAEALAKAFTNPPDLVLLDLVLRDCSGFSVLRALKQDPRTADAPVIMITASADVNKKIEGFDLGAHDYVVKPFDRAELRARVRSALRMKRCQDLLASRSRIDAVTGIWNRAYFDRRLDDEVAAARRYGRRFALLMIDIDHFKSVNDGYGHPFGDRLLQAVADVLGQSVRAGDAACRYGGEEFGVILAESGREQAYGVALRMRERVAALELQAGGVPVKRTISVGLAASDDFAAQELDAAALLQAADAALYSAKRSGRNRVCLASALRASEAEVIAPPGAELVSPELVSPELVPELVSPELVPELVSPELVSPELEPVSVAAAG